MEIPLWRYLGPARRRPSGHIPSAVRLPTGFKEEEVTSEIHSQSDEADRAAMPPDGRIDLRELALGPSKRPDRVSMREKILAEALKLFLEKGYTATSLEEIGAAAGITAAGTYRH